MSETLPQVLERHGRELDAAMPDYAKRIAVAQFMQLAGLLFISLTDDECRLVIKFQIEALDAVQEP